jgi:BCCT family betaine/carnitine transporter
MLGLLVAAVFMAPVELTAMIISGKDAICMILGSFYLLIVIACLVLSLWFAFSKYGSIRMGSSKPEYSTFCWVSMIFCAATGTSVLYWSALEWVYYIQWPPFGYGPLSKEALEISVSYSFFHWGFASWSIYAAGAVPLAYRYYVMRRDGLSLQNACEGVLGSTVGALGTAVNVLFVFGILSGLTISYGTGVPMLVNNLANIIGINESFLANMILIFVLTSAFTISTAKGLQNGMRLISGATIWFCTLLCLLFFLLGYPRFEIENTLQAFGLLVDKFPVMLTNLDTIGKSGFPQAWTVFFWAWCICLAPWMWIFIAKISRGRSIRSIIAAVVLAGSAGSIIFFSTISNYGLKAYIEGALDIADIMAAFNPNQVIADICLSLPFGGGVLVIWFAAGFLLLVTTMDSASFTLAAASVRGLALNEEPPKKLRMFWALLLSVSPLCLLYAGQFINGGTPLGSLQSMLVLIGVPVSLTVIFVMISGVKWLLKDHSHLTIGTRQIPPTLRGSAEGSKLPVNF